MDQPLRILAIEPYMGGSHARFLRGLQTHSRAPVVAALYGARRAGIDVDAALADVCAKFPDADPAPEFRAALRRLAPVIERTKR